MQYKESPAICGIRVHPLKKPGFSMLHYSVNQAIKYKKSVIKIQNSMVTKCKVNNTYKSYGIHMYMEVVLCLLFRLQSGRSKFHHWKWTSNFKGYILHVSGADPGLFLGGGAPLRNGVTDSMVTGRKQILIANTKKKDFA